MFAYCNNNSVMYHDELGHSLRPTTVAMNDGTGGDRHSGTTNNTDIQEVQDVFVYNEPTAIKHAVSTAINDIEGLYETIKCIGVGTGINKMKNGLKTLLLPDPTFFNEIVGAVQLVWGFGSLITNLGDLFSWSDDR